MREGVYYFYMCVSLYAYDSRIDVPVTCVSVNIVIHVLSHSCTSYCRTNNETLHMKIHCTHT